MYGDSIGNIEINFKFDDMLLEKIEEAFNEDVDDEIVVEPSYATGTVSISSNRLDTDQLIDIARDHGLTCIGDEDGMTMPYDGY